jgi:hypothetical protein
MDAQHQTPEKSASRTVYTSLTGETHSRLTAFAQTLQSGRGHWDYGVAIKYLLDFHEQNVRQASLNEVSTKLDYLLSALSHSQNPEQNDKEEFVEMLGGHTLKKE